MHWSLHYLGALLLLYSGHAFSAMSFFPLRCMLCSSRLEKETQLVASKVLVIVVSSLFCWSHAISIASTAPAPGARGTTQAQQRGNSPTPETPDGMIRFDLVSCLGLVDSEMWTPGEGN